MSLWNLKRPRLRVFGLRTQVIIVSPWNLKYRQLKREASVSSNKKCIEKGAMCKHDSLKKTLGRRALLLHLSDFSCQYQRRVVDTKIYYHKCILSISTLYQGIAFLSSSLQSHRMSCSLKLYSHKMSHSVYTTHIRREPW